MKNFTALCQDCHQSQRVLRHEIIHATAPRCKRCGGTLELSTAAQEDLARIQAAQAGARGNTRPGRPARPTTEEPVRILPVRETTRYEFWEHETTWDIITSGKSPERFPPAIAAEIKSIGPIEFYRRQSQGGRPKTSAEAMAADICNCCESLLVGCHRPYYKVWPSIAEALCHTEMRVDGEQFHVPYQAFEVRLPKRDNPLEPARAILVALCDGDRRQDGRQASLVIFFTDGPYEDKASKSWLANIPVRPGLSLEDALDQTKLAQECPDPGLARRVMRVAVGIAFFGVDNHEVILPEVRRRTLERLQRQRREPTIRETTEALAEARELGLFGFKVGSEIDLPRALPPEQAEHEPGESGVGRQLTSSHVRRGHMALLACGPERAQRRLTFRAPTVVRPDLPMQQTHGYRVRLQ